jgi:hypothetical protein
MKELKDLVGIRTHIGEGFEDNDLDHLATDVTHHRSNDKYIVNSAELYNEVLN